MKKTDIVKLERIGARVRTVRVEKGLTQAELAEAIHCTQNNVSKIERGVSGANLENLARIAEVCGVSLDYLQLRTDYKTHADAVRAAIGQMQQDDALWSAFVRRMAECSGYDVSEADRSGVDPADTDAAYLVFEKDGVRDDLSISDVNRFIREVTQHAGLSLQMMLERRRC